MKNKAVFLDRDGTINVEKDYLYKIEDFEFIPGAPEAIRQLKNAGFSVIVVTNQSGVARGYYNLEDVELLHKHVQNLLREYDTSVDAFYVCPHHPDGTQKEYAITCNCRKGEAGMLFAATEAYDICLTESFIVGDKLSDVEAGWKAGCSPLLVMTGYGTKTSRLPEVSAVVKCSNLSAAADLIVGRNEIKQGRRCE